MDERQLMTVVGDLYSASVDASEWPTALESLQSAFRSSSSMYSNVDLEPTGPPLGVLSGLDVAIMSKWAASRDHVDVWYRALSRRDFGSAYVSEDLVPTESLRKTAFYADMLQPHGVEYCLGGSTVESENRKWILAVYRGDTHGTYSPKEVEAFRLLTPHFERVLTLIRRHEALLAENAALSDALNLSPFAVFVCNSKNLVIKSNSHAEFLLERDDGVSVSGRRIHLWNIESNKKLQQQLGLASNARSVESSLPCEVIVAPSKSGKKPFHIMVVPVLKETSMLPSSLIGGCLVFVRDPNNRRRPDQHALTVQYGLTESEACLCFLLFEYGRVGCAAEAAGVSVNTAKTQLKRAYKKIGVRTQIELARELSESTFHTVA